MIDAILILNDVTVNECLTMISKGETYCIRDNNNEVITY